ncbi:hypothetical protein RvY_11805-2 [Ramazzottius varieornatus]|uniref:Uncharacterized protein n=1 Tax=Ramazzottius varieornatus TaxID=947166 RepID=A0A1D1VR52_RAMVA|nr:hypothetical protein RvY_11805-2 [Ramazzottius varieornatus]
MISFLPVALGFATVLNLVKGQFPWEGAQSNFDPQQFENFYAPAERRRLIKAEPSLVPVITFKKSASSFTKQSNELDIGSSSFSAVKGGRSSRTARTLDGPSREPRHWMLDELNNQDLASSSIGQDAAVVTAYDATKDWNFMQRVPAASTRRNEDFLETHNGGYILTRQSQRPEQQQPLFRTNDRPMFFDYRLVDAQQRRVAAEQEYRRRAAIAKQKLRSREQSQSDTNAEKSSDGSDSAFSDNRDAASGQVFSRLSEQDLVLRQQELPPEFQQQDPRQRPRRFMVPPFMQQPDQLEQGPVPPQYRPRFFGRPVFDGDQDRLPPDNGFNGQETRQQLSDGPPIYPPNYEGQRGPPPQSRPIFAGEIPQNFPMRQYRPQRPRQPPPTDESPPGIEGGEQPRKEQQVSRQRALQNRPQFPPQEGRPSVQQQIPSEINRRPPPQNRPQRPMVRRPIQQISEGPPPEERPPSPAVERPEKALQSAESAEADAGVDRSVQPWNDDTLVRKPLFQKSQRPREPPQAPDRDVEERPPGRDQRPDRPQFDPNRRRRPMPNRRPSPSGALRRLPTPQQQQPESVDGLPQSDFDKRFPVFAPDRLDGTQRKKPPMTDDESNMEPGYVPVSKLRRFLYETSKLSSSSHGDLTESKDSKKGSTSQNASKNKPVDEEKSEPGYGPPNIDDGTDKEIKIGG